MKHFFCQHFGNSTRDGLLKELVFRKRYQPKGVSPRLKDTEPPLTRHDPLKQRAGKRGTDCNPSLTGLLI